MELLLNLVWLAVAAMGAWLLICQERAAPRRARSRAGWGAWVGYLVLIAMLLPAISMTDDLRAMVAPSDGEQVSRRFDASLVPHHPAPLHGAMLHSGSPFFSMAPVSLGTLQTQKTPSNPPLRNLPVHAGRAPPLAYGVVFFSRNS